MTFEPVKLLFSEKGLEDIRQVIREELQRHEGFVRAAMQEEIEAYHNAYRRGLDHLMTAIDTEPEPEDEIVAVLASMTEDEWQMLVQRVRERKSAE